METIYHEFTIRNAEDLAMVKRGFMKEDEVRQATERFVIDTGAEMTVITDELFDRLGLSAVKTRPAYVAGGAVKMCRFSGPVEIQWRDRAFFCEVAAMPDQTENLMGNSTMESLDISINTRTGELYGNHGDQIVLWVR